MGNKSRYKSDKKECKEDKLLEMYVKGKQVKEINLFSVISTFDAEELRWVYCQK